jgi:hypothetical protein
LCKNTIGHILMVDGCSSSCPQVAAGEAALEQLEASVAELKRKLAEAEAQAKSATESAGEKDAMIK